MRRIDIYDLPEEIRSMVGECELTGQQTAFERNGRNVAALVSWDEYLALRETIAVAKEPPMLAAIRRSDAEAERGAIDTPDPALERIKLPKSMLAREDVQRVTALRAALARIDDDPIVGAPLFEPLRGVWSYREGSMRILYRVQAEVRMILVLSITMEVE